MPLNPSIALSAAPVQFPDPLANYARVMQIQQAQNQNALAQYQLAAAQRGEEQQNRLAAYIAANMPQGEAGLAQFGAPGYAALEAQRKAHTARIDQELKVMEVASQRLAGATEDNYPQLRASLVAMHGPLEQMLPPNYDEKRIQDLAQQGATQSDTIKTMRRLGFPLTQEGFQLFNESKAYTPSSDIQGYEQAKKDGFTGTFFQYKQQLAQAGRTPAQPREPAAPVAVVDPTTGKPVYVSRESAVGMTPASAMEGLSPKEIQKREAAHPQATAAIKAVETNADTFIKQLESLRDHPGLGSITGLVYGRTPSVTKEGRAAQALYDQIVAKGGFSMLQSLRDASKTGGALGNVSNQEGTQLKSAFAAIDRTQDAADVKKAINEAIESIRGAKTRSREAYDATYEYKSATPAQPAPAAGGRREIAPGVFVTERP